MKSYVYLFLIVTGLMAATLQAEPLKITGTATLPLNRSFLSQTQQPAQFLRFAPSPDIQKLLRNRVTQLKSLKMAPEETPLPSSIMLGMNGTPVLDQGLLGTCVTFAVTAAIDAALNKGDYVSQLCSLTLGATLAKNGYFPSGWSGTNADRVLELFQQFGIVNKTYQFQQGCGGLKTYPEYPPADDPANDPAMPLSDYHAASEDVSDLIHWKTLYSLFKYEIIEPRYDDVDRNVYLIKYALAHKQRVVLGFFMVFGEDITVDDTIGNYKEPHDTLILTQKVIDSIKNGNKELFGHEVVITGYDDNAIAYDHNGNPHKGLFYLRNSFGTDTVGHGDQYITYDYIKLLSDEAISLQVKNLKI